MAVWNESKKVAKTARNDHFEEETIHGLSNNLFWIGHHAG